MAPNEMMGSQVKCLLSGVSGHGDRHLAEVETDLVQMNILLSEAIKKLGASFMAIHGALCIQQETVNLLLSGGTPAPECVARLEAIHGEIGQHVNAAVTGLQFQDMTSQLIGRMVTHLAGLRDVFGALDSGSANVLPESDHEDIVTLLDSINQMLAERSVALEGAVRKAVSQRHMESGEIELF
ncbi:chemotaxis protein [Sulfuriferula sp.]|uniref:chemotaxis protein n=1 Tax=Sulfuriferula sp. TaxID=2025307 RepID=UPI002731DE45|nr:chemotaxis protein [Sulfuriferula sp.]MDP2025157.1 chemotaxis protein [Sulfuriferula sp.]